MLASIALALSPPAARATETLKQAMADSYRGNPTLAAARDQVRVADEQVSLALSALRPSAAFQGSLGVLVAHQWESFDPWNAPSQYANFDYKPKTLQASATQAVYHAGALSAGITVAEAKVGVQLAQLVGTEQSVLYRVGSACANIILASTLLALAQEYEAALVKARDGVSLLAGHKDRTLTDLAQAQTRLASARTDVSQARAQLAGARAAFEAAVGRPATGVPEAISLSLPAATEDAALAISLQHNPAMVGSRHALAAAESNIDVAVGNWLPSIDASASYLYAKEAAAGTILQQDREAWLQFTFPIFSGGAPTSLIRQSGYLVAQRQFDLKESEIATTATLRQAWQAVATARQVLAARTLQSEAAERALVGVNRQHTLGMRTFLDTLDALRESINIRGDVAKAMGNLTVAQLQLLAATGVLTATHLGLPVTLWDNAPFLREAREAWQDLGQ